MISRKTTNVPLKSPVAPSAAVANGDQHNEVGIDIGNAAMATPNSQSSQSSAGVVRIESTESLSSRRRNESEPLSKYSQEKYSGSHEYLGHQPAEGRNSIIMASGKPPVKRSSSERYNCLLSHYIIVVVVIIIIIFSVAMRAGIITSKHITVMLWS